MFSKPKRARATAHPRSGEEALAVQKGLLEKYPDMAKKTGSWSKPKVAKPEKKPEKTTARTKAVEADLRNSGLTEAEIKKLRGER